VPIIGRQCLISASQAAGLAVWKSLPVKLCLCVHYSADFHQKTKHIFVWTAARAAEDILFSHVEMDALLLSILLLLERMSIYYGNDLTVSLISLVT